MFSSHGVCTHVYFEAYILLFSDVLFLHTVNFIYAFAMLSRAVELSRFILFCYSVRS